VADPNLYGIMGYSYLNANKDKIQASDINGKSISLSSIQDYSYPIARPLFIYFKKEHLDVVPGLREFMKAYVSRKAMGPRGYLGDLGLVPLDDITFKEMVKRTKSQ
jgi:phosphate transport system substrate-binding protein